MKVRLVALVLVTMYAMSMLPGCASGPSVSTWDVGNKPQMMLPGASRSDVKSLAMGSARSKGWSVVKSTDDQLVMQRPLDPASPAVVALGVGPAAAPVVEVTSLFLEESGGVNVVLGAELVTKASGDKEAKRVDFTETYRDALNKSLDSLRTSWSDSQTQTRIARAVPPVHQASDDVQYGTVPDTSDGDASKNPLVRTWADAVDEEHAAKAQEGRSPTPYYAAPPPSAAAPAPEYAAPAATPAAPMPSSPTPAASPPTPAPTEVAAAPQPQYASPEPRYASPEPRYASPAPAPVVDGYAESQPSAPSRPAPEPLLLPSVPSEPAPGGENMLTLNESSGSGSWGYYAEQYARLRGCSVSDQGSVLVESRSDGEIHKVPCQGADSFLLKCQNGVCRDLQ